MAGIEFTILCTDEARRDRAAKYKIGAQWKGRGYSELKTFGFADDECLERVFCGALDRATRIHFDEGEQLGEMCIYILDRSRHDYELARATDLEHKLRGRAGGSNPQDQDG